MHAGILIHEGIKTPEELADMNVRALTRLLNLDEEQAEKILEAARVKAEEELASGQPVDTGEYSAEDAIAVPDS